MCNYVPLRNPPGFDSVPSIVRPNLDVFFYGFNRETSQTNSLVTPHTRQTSLLSFEEKRSQYPHVLLQECAIEGGRIPARSPRLPQPAALISPRSLAVRVLWRTARSRSLSKYTPLTHAGSARRCQAFRLVESESSNLLWYIDQSRIGSLLSRKRLLIRLWCLHK